MVEVARRYSKLDQFQKTLRDLRRQGLITSDGSVVVPPSRSEPAPSAPFKLDQRLSPETIAEIIARYEAGESSPSLATTFSLSKGSIIRLLREADIPIRNQPLTEEQVNEAALMYESGQSLAKIAAHLGVDHTTVRRQLLKYGVRMRDSHGRNR